MPEIFDDYCWQKHKQVITREKHHIPGLANFAHWRMNSSIPPSPTHYHSDIWEIHCMIKGKRISFLEQMNGRVSYTITGNEAFITFPYELHGNGNLPQMPCEFYAFQIDMKERNNLLCLNKEYSNALCDYLLSIKHRHLQMSTTEIQLIRMAFNLFSSENIQDVRNGVLFLSCFLSNLCYMLPVEKGAIHPFNPNIQQSIDYIRENISRSLSLQELAEASGYSLSRFKTNFKEEVGITPNEYILLQKMEQAKHMLETSDIQITKLAYELGFSSSNYFSSVFKKLLNCNPMEYRKNFNSYLQNYASKHTL